jgi:amidase
MNEYGIKEIQSLFESGELTSELLTQQYLDRIKEIDISTNAIIELNPDALDLARKMDEERKNGTIRGPMHGIPVILKDNIDTNDKMMTTAGSLALEGNYAKKDAFIVKQLREAGAVILAKGNLSEWANFRGKRSSSGWSSRGGQTHNPYALNRSPCGSSSGSAVAVAANLCTVSIGTETDGSVICPANANGIVGIKPTIGLCSRSGIIPIAHTQDTAGPMGRTVEDTTILLGAIVGYDEVDPITDKATKIDYTQFLDKEGLKGTRLGFSKSIMSSVPKVEKVMETIMKKLKELGAELVEFDDFPKVEELDPAEFNVLLYEFKEDLNNYLSTLSTEVKVHSMEDVIKFNEDNDDKVLPHFDQEHFVSAVDKGDLNSEEYLNAIKLYDEYREKITSFLDDNKLDAMIAPSGGPAWFIDHINGDSFTGVTSTSAIAAITGFSNITVPAGYISGLPIGLSFIGRAFDEPTIIKLAYSFEQGTQYRKTPTFNSSI